MLSKAQFLLFDEKKRKGKTYLMKIDTQTGSIKDEVYLNILSSELKQNNEIKNKILIENLKDNDAVSFAYASSVLNIKSMIVTEEETRKNLELINLFGSTVLNVKEKVKKELINKMLVENMSLTTLSLDNYKRQEKFHENVTGKLIVDYLVGNIDIIIIPMYSSSMAMGISEYIKYINEYVKIVGVTTIASKLSSSIYNDYNLDEVINVEEDEMNEELRVQAKKGLLLGKESLSAIVAYRKIKEKYNISTKNVVIIASDTFFRYNDWKNI